MWDDLTKDGFTYGNIRSEYKRTVGTLLEHGFPRSLCWLPYPGDACGDKGIIKSLYLLKTASMRSDVDSAIKFFEDSGLAIEKDENCTLVDYKIKDIAKKDIENLINGRQFSVTTFMPFHVEPFYKFLTDPPNERWNLFKRGSLLNSYEWLESKESREFIKLILKLNGICLKESSSDSLSPSKRFDILKRDNYRCQICGRTALDGVTLEVDHKYPASKGGTFSYDNLWTLCRECNIGKGAKLL